MVAMVRQGRVDRGGEAPSTGGGPVLIGKSAIIFHAFADRPFRLSPWTRAGKWNVPICGSMERSAVCNLPIHERILRKRRWPLWL